tara:strand:- start:960 stop:2435 length:1476 start_codon:yes stop_codon:yes gene_type:complete
MANRIINPDSIPYLKKFFDNHKLFYVTDFPWQFFNVENGTARYPFNVWDPNDNKKMRYRWMCDEHGFFNVTQKDRNSFFRILEYALNKDNPYTLRQRRYLTQQLVELDGFTSNPIHFSVRPKSKNATLDLDDYKSCELFELICHPGGTRAAAHTFLRSNGKKLFLYFNKRHFSRMEFKYSHGVEEIDNWSNLTDYFNPTLDADVDLIYDFHSEFGDTASYKNKMKYHKETECNVLKLFSLKELNDLKSPVLNRKGDIEIDPNEVYRFLKTDTFHSDAFSDSHNISKILTNSVLNLYTNGDGGIVHKVLSRNRQNLLGDGFKDRYHAYSSINFDNIVNYMRWHRPDFNEDIDSRLYDHIMNFFSGIIMAPNKESNKKFDSWITNPALENNLIDEYRFDYDDKYIEIENDFIKIVKENDYKGYAIWIDKSVLLKMDREIYEFLYIVRNDIAITKTKNDKVAIINCEHEDWKTNELNSKSIWTIEDSFAYKEEE